MYATLLHKLNRIPKLCVIRPSINTDVRTYHVYVNVFNINYSCMCVECDLMLMLENQYSVSFERSYNIIVECMMCSFLLTITLIRNLSSTITEKLC